MDVYVIPTGADRYALYCEPGDETEDAAGEVDGASGWFGGLVERFRIMLARIDYREADPGQAAAGQRGWVRRLGDRGMRWLAHAVAEQRLLWRLRRHREAQAYHPGDLTASAAGAVIKRVLQRDLDRHRIWMSVHGAAFVLSGVFFFVPGPNLIAYYFAFRLVGHYLSSRGASQGLKVVRWTHTASDPLTRLRRARGLSAADRQRVVDEVAMELKLAHLPRFFRRTAERSA